MFTLTSAAAQQIQQAAVASNTQHLALRLAAKVDADGSLQYGMGFDEPAESDLKLNLEGISVVIGTDFQQLLDETTLDFVEMRAGEFNFIFIDGRQVEGSTPNACAMGGCGNGGCGSQGGACH